MTIYDDLKAAEQQLDADEASLTAAQQTAADKQSTLDSATADSQQANAAVAGLQLQVIGDLKSLLAAAQSLYVSASPPEEVSASGEAAPQNTDDPVADA